MNIGLLAVGFAVVCSIITLIGYWIPQSTDVLRDNNYKKIYSSLMPKEL